jgi:putative nucleotidyltransferase with HDIG domain
MSISILVITPSKYVAGSFKSGLAPAAWSVYTLSQPERIPHMIERVTPDIVVIDPDFEGLNAFRLCQRIVSFTKRLNGHPVPVVFYATGTRENIMGAVDAGAEGYIVKPASLSTILLKIKKVLEKAGIDTESAPEKSGAPAEQSLFTRDMDAEERVAALLRRAKSIKTIPFTVSRTLKITSDPTTGARDLAKVITSDTAAAATVLRRANSARRAADRPIGDVKAAIVRLGFDETKSLVIGLRVIKAFRAKNPGSAFTRSGFWEHSLGVGLLAMHLAQKSGICDATYAFVGGLLHDVGKLTLDDYVPVDFSRAVEHAQQADIPLVESEQKILGVTHTAVGGALMRQWSLPREIQEIALHHNTPGEELARAVPEEHAPVCNLIRFCNGLAKALRLGCAGEELLVDFDDELLDTLNVNEAMLAAIEEQIREEIRDFKEFLQMPERERTGTAARGMPRQVVFAPPRPKALSPFSLYLQRSGCTVKLIERLEELKQGLADADQGAVTLIDLPHSADPEGAAATARELPERAVVAVLGTADQVRRWNELAPPGPRPALTKPLDGRSFLAKLAETAQAESQSSPESDADKIPETA